MLRRLSPISVASAVTTLYRRNPEDVFFLALRDVLAAAGPDGWALIGGLAVGFHSEPRGTQDVDLAITGDAGAFASALVAGGAFRRIRPHAVEHKATGIEVELLTAAFLGLPPALVAAACRGRTWSGVRGVEIPVASARAVVALKLGRAAMTGAKAKQDQADIMRILVRHPTLSIAGLPVGAAGRALFAELKKEAK